MTPPVTTEALEKALSELSRAVTLAHDDYVRLGDYAGWNAIQSAEHQVSKLFDTLLAAHQQVTAERDEAREVVARCNNSFGSYSYHLNPHPAEQIEKVKWQARSEWQRAETAEAALATVNADLARLRAEGEALKGALKPFSAGGKWGVWLAWIVNGAPDREQGKAAAKQIVQWRAAVDIALSPNPTAEAAKPIGNAPWPSGCIKPNACARHRQCVYAMSAEKCRHFGQDLGPAIEAADAARAATAKEGQADA